MSELVLSQESEDLVAVPGDSTVDAVDRTRGEVIKVAQSEAALITAPGTVEMRPFERSTPDSHQLVVDVHLCGVCVTEVKSYRDGSGHGASLCGHEWVGTVTEVGDAVAAVVPGDRVVIAVPEPCGTCGACRSDRSEFCSVVLTVARGRDEAAPPHGAFARSLTVADYRVLPVPARLSDVDAALVEPAAVAFHGVARAGITPGASVVVLGAGPIGLLALQIARAAGATTTVVVEPVPNRRAAALELGGDGAAADLAAGAQLVDELTQGTGPDVVFECVGTGEAIQQAVDLARPGGRVVLLGDASAATVSPRLWLAKEVTVVASAGYSRRDIEEVMDLMVAGKVRTGPLHTRTVALGELSHVLDDFVNARTGDIKVLVDPRLRFPEEEE